MKRQFDDNLYQFDRPQSSYWEATAPAAALDVSAIMRDDSCEVAIIGGGYTGLSAALHLARDFQADVRVLEAGHIGWGASGRNGGFCCTGGTGVHGQDLVRLVGLDAVREYYKAQLAAVELVRQIAADEHIDYQAQGDAEVVVAHTARAFKRMHADHELMTRHLGLQAELISAGECRERYYDCTENFGALVNRPAFGLHPLRYCRGLAAAASRHGARVHAQSRVIEWSRSSDGRHRLVTRSGTLTARKVIFCSNGFIQEDLHAEFFGRAMPVISAIIATRPLRPEELAAQHWRTENPAINSRHVLNYFRLLPDQRFLFGGRGSTNGSPDNEQRTYADMERRFRAIWPAWSEVEFEYRWHGLICMTASLCPTIGQLAADNSVYFGFGYHGNGVNTATWTGQQLANWIGTGREPKELPAIVRGLSRRYPLPGLRQTYLRFGIFLARQLDRIG
ncbi:MAG: FAD-binding oxidoreductase [Gammaproteobacteria bacterium]|nr:FAD-binding oxidoreductase [Gammaproteobacteria bacterium]MDH5303658.1 FAD-binding oxidoreductase [Gammaproteobacteria bacterium]MDH5322342.1 FAD-binding oxidoreductase [Gammaproteobacteria bacterium]